MITLIENGVREFHNYILTKPICADFLAGSSTNIHIEINGISIRAVGQHPKFYAPFHWLVLDILSNP